jgi:hypothetical protein
MLWEDVAQEAELTRESLRLIRAGGNMRPRTKRRIERALQWEKGSVDAILSGSNPTPIPEPDPKSSDLVRRAINALADLEITGADVSTYNRELGRWEHILGDDADITSVRKDAHRIAVEHLANPQNNATL